MATPICFDEYSYHPATGELVRRDNAGTATTNRLPPQPAKLLALLLDRYPEIVSREEIRAAIWPDVEIDFDRGLHFCVRQVRTALEESAAMPRFIETIPRRGYRWLVPPHLPDEQNSDAINVSSEIHEDTAEQDLDSELPPALPASRTRTKRSFPLLIAAATVLASIVLVQLFTGGARSNGTKATTRIAVMPMQPRDATHDAFAGNTIAEEILAALTIPIRESLDVIGPTTTVAYDDNPQRLRAVIDDLAPDYIINGRFTMKDGTPRILMEIIRGSDGAHVWVRYFGSEVPARDIAGPTCAGLDSVLTKQKAGDE